MKFTRKNSLVALALAFCLGAAMPVQVLSQVVKTWSFSTSGGVQKSGGPKLVDGVDCNVEIEKQLDVIGQMFALQEDVEVFVQEGRVLFDYFRAMKERITTVDAYLPEKAAYPEKGVEMVSISDKCQDKNQKYLSPETVTRVKSLGADMQAAAEKAITELGVLNAEAMGNLGAAEDDIFVSTGNADTDPAKADKMLKDGRKALEMLETVLGHYPAQKATLAPKVAELKQKFDATSAKIGEVRAKVFVSEYHKTHPATVAVASGIVSPGNEAALVKSTWKPGEEFNLVIMCDNYFREFTVNNTFRLQFFIGERAIEDVEFYIKDYDKIRNTASFTSFFLFGASPKDNLDASAAYDGQLSTFFKTMSTLTPKAHEMRILVSPRDGGKMAEGKFTMDLSGQPTGEGNWFAKAAQAMVDYKEQVKREEIFSYFSFKNLLNEPAFKAKVEAAIVAESEGRIKGAKVFFSDTRWTAYVNAGGTPMYRSIFFSFIVESSTGEFYVGHDVVSQDGLLGGGFDTQQVSPAFTPFDTYTNDFKDMWDHNNNGTGMYQIKVPREKIAAYYK